jgi:iron complex outermembrane receptor protein
MRKTKTLITSATAILIASAIAQATTPLPATGEGGTAQRGVRESASETQLSKETPVGVSSTSSTAKLAHELRTAQAEPSNTSRGTAQTASTSEPKITFDIDAPKLSRALIQLTEQSGLQLIYPAGEKGTDLPAKPLKGEYTTESALKQLLKGTGLSYEFIDAKTISIVDPSAKSLVKTTLRGTDGSLTTGPLRLAQNTGSTGTSDTGEAQTTEASASENNNKGESPDSSSDTRKESLQEIVVTGSRLRATGLEGPSPITVFERPQLDALGVTSVVDVLKYLPAQPYNRSEPFRKEQFAELRGLGVDTTLVLINGRRTVPSASSVSANAFDLNTIPLAAVERVEVLSDAASAVYGADAVGGVVNIILRKEVDATTMDLRYGATEAGGSEKRASVTTGLHGARFRSSLVLDYLRRDFLLGRDRDRWSNQDFTRFGGFDQRSLNSDPGNITSRTSANLPGLSERFATVPDGSTGIGLTPADFAATAGARNYDSLARWSAIVPQSERASVATFGELDLRPGLTAFGEALYANRKTQDQASPSSLSGTAVPATNAFNPFGVAVSANFLIDGLGPRRIHADSELYRGVLGLRGPLARWDWEASVMSTQEKAATWTANAADPVALAAALASSDPVTALNVFQDGAGGSDALLRSLIAPPDRSGFTSRGTQATAFMRGPLASLPGGEMEAVVGAERRREDIRYDDFLFVEADRDVSAAFAELSVPLVNARMQWPAVRSLSLKLAARFDDYSDFGHSTNPQYGLVWNPLRDLALRVSYGRSFRPPSLFELYAPRVTAPLTASDPRRNNEVVDTIIFTGGNPSLGPASGKSLTTGFIWTPAALPGARLAASWWKIDFDDRVSFLPFQVVLANEASFPTRVVRGTPSPADVAAGLPGSIESIDISRINSGTLQTDGIDLAATYAFDTDIGRWTANVVGTWVNGYRSVDFPGAPPLERVGLASFNGTIARWRATAALGWRRNAWAITATGRSGAAYEDADGSSALPNGRRIPGQMLLDLQVEWAAEGAGIVDGSMWSGMRASLGASNVFDKEPPYAAIGGSLGYDTSQGDLRQRFVYFNVSKRF